MTIIASNEKKIIVRDRSVVGDPAEVAAVAENLISQGRLLDHGPAKHLGDGRVAVRLRVAETEPVVIRKPRNDFPWKTVTIFGTTFLAAGAAGYGVAPDQVPMWAAAVGGLGMVLGPTVWFARRRQARR